MSWANRLTLAAAGVIASLALLAGWASRYVPPAEIWLLDGHQFTRRELAAMAGAFAKSQLDEYEVLEGRVRIPRPRRSAYIKSLVDHRALPTGLHASPRELSVHPFESLQQQRMRSRHELQQQLAECIRAMEGVEDATVHLDEAVLGRGFQREHKVTAAVTICPEPDAVVSPALMRSIGKLVAGAKAELSPEDVTITDLSTGIALRGGAGSEQERHDEVRLWKRHYEQQVLQRLQPLRACLAESRWAVEVTMKWHAGPMSAAALPAEAKTPTDPPRCLPVHVAITAEIPAAYYRRVWRQRAPHATRQAAVPSDGPDGAQRAALEEETRQQIESQIATRLPRWGSEPLAWNLQLATVPQTDTAAALRDRSQPVWNARRVSISLGCLGLASAGVWSWSRRRRVPHHPPAPAAPFPATASEPTPPRPAATDRGPARNLDGGPGKSEPAALVRLHETSAVHSELTQLVRENPKLVAEMLKQWVGKAG